jgi:FecR protein
MSSRSIFQSHRASLGALLLLSLLSVSVALADDESDPPGRVARLSYVNGSVSLQPAGVEDWADATVNRPLTTGDKLWTDRDSRAELDIGSAAIRLGSMTGFSFLNLDDQTAQMNITAGTAIVHLRDLGEDQSFEIDTPNVAVALQSPGDYRVQVNEAGDTTVVKVSTGDAQVSAAGQSVPLHTQQAYTFTGTNQVSADATSVGAPDALDSWSLERDHRSEQAQAQTSEYVSPDVAGADDLVDYGTWESTPEYGPVWTPTVVAAGWSPYQFGRWVWVAPWGWTWVDDAPWGFAPFHYGRWAYRGTRWCWVPGPRHVRPVYAPALVAWVGSPDGHVSISVRGGAGVGWFPLGPREVYVPGYRVSHNYVRNVNITNTTFVNTTYITNVYENRVNNITYVNRNRPGAVVAVSQDVFTSSRRVYGNTMHIPEHELTRFNAHGAGPAIAPVRESVLGRRPDMNVRRPPAALLNRPIVARTAPPPAPVPFERQQEAIRANGGRPLARSQITQLQPAAATNPRVRVVGPGPTRPIQNGGQQFGTARPGQAGGIVGSRPTPADRGPNADRPATGGGQFGTARPGQSVGVEGDRPGAGADRPAQQGGITGSVARPNIENQREPTIQERERALHATPIPSSPRQDALRNDRPPASQMRNDQYRMQNTEESRRQAQEVRPTPEARPNEQPRAVEQPRPFQARPTEQSRAAEQPRPFQARPIEQPRAAEQPPQLQARPIEQPRAVEQPRQFQARPIEQPRAVEQPPQLQARPFEQPRAAEQPRQFQARPEAPRAAEQPRQLQARPIEQPRQEFRAPEPRPIQRAPEQPRQVEAPRAAPPQPRQAPPQQQQRTEDRRGRPGDPRINR